MKIIFTILSLVSVTSYAQLIILNSSTLYQTMDGWRGTAEIGQVDCITTAMHTPYSYCPGNYTAWADSALDAAVEMGINSVRLEVQPSAENTTDYAAQYLAGTISRTTWKNSWYQTVNDNADPNTINPAGFKWGYLDYRINTVVIPLRQKLAARGETLRIEITYPDYGATAFEQLNNPAEYAEFVLAVYQHMQSAFGFVPDAWDVINEPDLTTPLYSGTQIGQAIKASGDKLTANGFTPSFNGPSTTSAGQARFHIDDMAAVPGALQYIHTFTYHRYVGADQLMVTDLWNRASSHGKKLAMTEYADAPNSYNMLHEDLKFGNNSSWEEFSIAYPGVDAGGTCIIPTGTNSVTVASRAKFYRQYFKYVRRGAVRYGATSNASNLDPLAFRNTDNTHVIVVKATSGGAVNIAGLPAGQYGIFYTTNSVYNQKLADQTIAIGQLVSTNIPAAGVITIYGKLTTPTGIAPLEASAGVLFYPNPSNGDLRLIFDMANNGIPKDLIIYDLFGKEVMKVIGISEPELLISKVNLPAGMYIYKAFQASELLSCNKLIIK